MKKILFVIAIVLTMGLTASAQRDGFFGNYESADDNREVQFNLPEHFGNNNESAPLGSGLIVLTALGAGYIVARKKINK